MSTASPDSFPDAASQTLTQHLPDVARRQLDALRAALEVRLSRLEAVLADPAYGESLEALILDLARVATQEARLTTTLACVDTKREADTELARVRAAAQAALDAERASGAELRRSVEQAGERIATLQREQQTQAGALRQQLDASLATTRQQFEISLARERSIAEVFERDLKAARQQLDTERSTTAGLRQTAGRVPELSAALEQEKQRADSAQRELSAAIARSQEAADNANRARAELQTELQSERAAVVALRQDLERAQEHRIGFEHEKAAFARVQQDLTREVTDLRSTLADSDRARAGLQAELDAALGSHEQLRQEIERHTALSTTFDREKAQALSLHGAVTTELARARELAADNERAWVDAQTQLDAERAAVAGLRQELDGVQVQRSALEREKADAERSLQGVTTELEDLRRRMAADHERTHTDLQSELDRERASLVASRQDIERLQALLTTIEREKAKLQRLYHELTTALAGAQQAASDSERARQDVQSQLESEQAVHADLRQALERDKALSTTSDKEKARTVASQKELTADLKRARKAAADSERAREDAQSQLEKERTVSAELREQLDRDTARARTLEQERATALDSHRELTAELARARDAASERERARDEAQSQLDAQRTANAELREQLERDKVHSVTSDQEKRKALAKQQELTAELARARDAAAAGDRALTELRAELDAERTSHTTSRQSAERDQARVTSADREKTKALQEVTSALTRAREDAAASDRSRAEAQTAIESERASNTRLRQELERAQALAASLERERADAERLHKELTVELRLAREAARAAELAAAEAFSQPPDAAPGSDAEPRGKGDLPGPRLVPPLPAGAIDSSWQGIRSANRFAFREPLAVQINGEPGFLFDLSIDGCQVQSTSRLKPNHGIRVILPREAKPVTCMGKVVWARLELPAAGRALGYRAGVQFTKPDQAAIEAFLARHFA